jgi:hypothetical protein
VENFSPSELQSIDGVDELRISSRRPDGSLRPFVIVWCVREGDDIYVRSAYGGGGWFRRAVMSGRGSIRAGGVERDVVFDQSIDETTHGRIDDAYHRKYDRYGAGIVRMVVGAKVRDLTLRVTPEPADR